MLLKIWVSDNLNQVQVPNDSWGLFRAGQHTRRDSCRQQEPSQECEECLFACVSRCFSKLLFVVLWSCDLISRKECFVLLLVGTTIVNPLPFPKAWISSAQEILMPAMIYIFITVKRRCCKHFLLLEGFILTSKHMRPCTILIAFLSQALKSETAKTHSMRNHTTLLCSDALKQLLLLAYAGAGQWESRLPFAVGEVTPGIIAR